jgi:hypothetical protein
MTLLFLAVTVALLVSLAVYHNCSSRDKWLPQSAGLCNDLYSLTSSGSLPKTAQSNVVKAAEGAQILFRQKSTDLIGYVQATDFPTLALDTWNSIRNHTIAAAQWTQKTAVHTVTNVYCLSLLDVTLRSVEQSGRLVQERRSTAFGQVLANDQGVRHLGS